jgi:hypothetical protein
MKIISVAAIALFTLATAGPAAAMSREKAWNECLRMLGVTANSNPDSRVTQHIEGCTAQKMREPDPEPASSKKKK